MQMTEEEVAVRKKIVFDLNFVMVWFSAVWGHGAYKSYNTYYRWSRSATTGFALVSLIMVWMR